MTGCEHHKGGEGEKQCTAVDAARKMLKFGISALTDVELLALFLRTGTRGKDVLTLAKEMLENFGSLYGLLTSEYEQFSGVHGIGVAKFAQLKGLPNWRGVTTTYGCVKKALYSARR
ncbi:hypothetical protein MUTS15_71120 [Escherichia coli]|nr:hypothetical protein MUTS15_71120 [Escherichia coli]